MDFSNNDEMLQYCSSSGRAYVSFSFKQAGRDMGSVVLELFTDIAPATCANFLKYVKATPRGYKVGAERGPLFGSLDMPRHRVGSAALVTQAQVRPHPGPPIGGHRHERNPYLSPKYCSHVPPLTRQGYPWPAGLCLLTPSDP